MIPEAAAPPSSTTTAAATAVPTATAAVEVKTSLEGGEIFLALGGALLRATKNWSVSKIETSTKEKLCPRQRKSQLNVKYKYFLKPCLQPLSGRIVTSRPCQWGRFRCPA